MQNLILYGFNTLAKELVKISKYESEYTVAYICIDQEYKIDEFYEDIPIIAFEDLESIKLNEFKILVTFGYMAMNGLKEEKLKLCKERGYPLTNFVSEKSSVYTSSLGISNIIMPHVVISNGTDLGDCNSIYPSTVIGHDCKIGNFNFISSCVDILGSAIIGNRCFLGGNSTILDKKIVADCTLVGAGAVVSQNTKPWQVLVPPRSITLKKSSKYFY